MASSEAYADSQFNLAAQGHRQPGSSFKPFVLTDGGRPGHRPRHHLLLWPEPDLAHPMGAYAEPWIVNGGGSGTMSLRQATANSINAVYAQLGIDVGPENFADMAQAHGDHLPLDGYPAEALGGLTEGVSVLEMSNAYATLANGGVHHDPTAIEQVEFPNGEVDEPEPDEGNRVLSDGVAYEVADVMKGTLDYGTAAGATSAARHRARPAPPRTRPTPGSSATRRTSRPRSGPATPTSTRSRSPATAPTSRRRSGTTTWRSRRRRLRRLPGGPGPGRPLRLLQRAHGRSGLRVRDDDVGDHDDDGRRRPSTRKRRSGRDRAARRRRSAYDPDLYAPGAGQEPAPTPDGGGGDDGGGQPG